MIQSFRRHDGLTCLASSETFTKKRNMIDSPWYVQLLRPQIFILAVTLSVIPLESITAQTAEKKETLKTENQVTELQLRTQAAAALRRTGTRKKLSQRLISSLKSFRSRPLRCSPQRILCSVAANLQSHSCISMNISKLNPMPFLTSGREVSRVFRGPLSRGC